MGATNMDTKTAGVGGAVDSINKRISGKRKNYNKKSSTL
jgi:hypothetical protein